MTEYDPEFSMLIDISCVVHYYMIYTFIPTALRQCHSSIYCKVSGCVCADLIKVKATFTEARFKPVSVNVYTLPSTVLQ